MRQQEQQDPGEASRMIAYLASRSDQDYEDALLGYVMKPQPGETAVFRSNELAQRSSRIVGLLTRECNRKIEVAARSLTVNPRDREAIEDLSRQKLLRNLLGSEGTALRHIADTVRIQNGQDPTAPNANSRALRALRKLHPEDFLRLKREAEVEIAAERSRAKRERREARQAEVARWRVGRGSAVSRA